MEYLINYFVLRIFSHGPHDFVLGFGLARDGAAPSFFPVCLDIRGPSMLQ